MPALHYTYYESPIGLIRIGGTEESIQVVGFVDKPDQMTHGEPGIPECLHQCTKELIEFFKGVRRQFTVKLAQEGTEFQQRVWHELEGIAYGRTISYLDLAKKLGDPKVIRAAASSNGRNNLAIIVPCHRVIGTNGSLIGYGGGLWRKRWLLEHEKKIAFGVQTLF